MRCQLSLALAFVLAAPALAQISVPRVNPTPALVTPSQAAAAGSAAQKAAATQQTNAAPAQNEPVVLDSVVAIINGDVLLESDVEEERRFESLQLLPSNENTDARAARHLITRTLILQQMKEQGQATPDITTADVDKLLAELKRQLPGCLPTRCQSEAGWASYLAGRGLSPEEVSARWRQRLIILDYLNLRFRTGIRIPRSQIRDYYQKNLVPQFAAKHLPPPPLKSVSARIQEILLQQQVSKQIDDWEATLQQQGSVRILVPAYGQSNSNADNDEDFPGGV